MNEGPAEFAEGDVCPKRFGLNYDPPSIVLEYLQVSTGKLFHRRIGLRRLRKSSDPGRVAEKLRQRNKALLEEDKVSFDQIVTLVTKLQESLGEDSDKRPEKRAEKKPQENSVQQGDRSSETAAACGSRAAPSSSPSASLSSSPHASPSASPNGVQTASKASIAHASPSAATSGQAEGEARKLEPGDPDLVQPEDGNLNKLSTEELDRHKARMDLTFFQNQKKPTDNDFVYDVQVDFPESHMPSGWDSDDSDEASGD